jgi:PAS domain S-box-containing protein
MTTRSQENDATILQPAAPLPNEGAQVRSLHDSYVRLLSRVAKMEKELARANAELRKKVGELDLAHSKLDAVLDAVPAGVIVGDEEGRVVRANPAARAILGAPAEEIVGKPLADIKNPRGTRLLDGPAREREVEGLDGTPRLLARSRSVVRDASGRELGSVDLLEDRTERRRLEQRLKHHEKLAALGEMSATVAHEVRNPLHSIEGFANLLLRALPDDAAASKPRDYAKNIVRGVGELNAIITNLLEFARAERHRPAARDLVAVARRAGEMALAGLAPDDAKRFSVEVAAPEKLIVAIDEVHIAQAVRNLVSNAIEAMPAGGCVRIAVADEAGGASVRVADEGPGIAPELRHRLFTPFFTTKSRGTGLGLAVVAKAAALHGGRVALVPSDKGAVFNLWIPHTPMQE